MKTPRYIKRSSSSKQLKLTMSIELFEHIERSALAHGRSRNGEALAILEDVLATKQKQTELKSVVMQALVEYDEKKRAALLSQYGNSTLGLNQYSQLTQYNSFPRNHLAYSGG